MWIEPVTFGGGSAIEKRGPSAEFSARKSFVVEPGLRPALLDLLRLVGLGYFSGHGFLVSGISLQR